ncbi:MAG: hypothetical protein K2L82_03090 [Lachnospiraceae bacterium]|nr:hypothetical protein [Lachnospiraceae bacterium]
MKNDEIFQSGFQGFCSGNLARAIQLAFPSMFPDLAQLREEIDKVIFPRLDFMVGSEENAFSFLFEARYVETEWKDMVGMHYINTSYEVENTVMRIHLFKKKKVSEKHYRGCFTMRTINEARIMLSYIYPNWKYVAYHGSALNVMTYQKKVHLYGKEITFCTYPLFAQDNTVVACAQACLVSMSKYLHSQYDYAKIQIRNINDSYHSNKTKVYPSSGLLSTQMLEILSSYNIPCGYQVYHEQEEFKEYIDYCIESAIPVLVGIHVQEENVNTSAKGKGRKNICENKIGRHVVQIIGHSDVNIEKRYVVYDDSGYYLRHLGEEGFVRCVPWETLRDSLQRDKSFIIYPIHEKVYILYDNFKKHVDDMLCRYRRDGVTTDGIVEREGRALLVDNRVVKQFLREQMVDAHEINVNVQEEARRILGMDMPHYLWCYEYYTPMGKALFIADPTYIRSTTKSIFLNKEPLISRGQISLLRYDD